MSGLVAPPPPPPQMTGRSLRRFARPAAAVAAAMALIIAYVPALPAMAQAQRGAIASVSLASDAAGQLVITWEAPESAPTDYRIAWANAELDWLSYSADNEDERGNAYPLVGVTTLTLDGLTPGDTYKVQMRSRYYNANRTVHEQSGPWTDVMTQRVNTAPPEPESEETTGGQTEAATEERSKGQTVLDRASAVPKSTDNDPPTFVSATVSGRTLVITFNEDLDPDPRDADNNPLTNYPFIPKKGRPLGNKLPLSGSPVISGRTVTLTLATAITATDTNVRISYLLVFPSDPTAPVRDLAGNDLEQVFSQPVTNSLVETDPPVLTAADPVLAADGVTLTLTFNEPLNTGSVPGRTQFTVNATPMGETTAAAVSLATISPVAVSGTNVTLKLATPIAHNDHSVTVAYSGSAIEDVFGNDARSFGARTVTNNSEAPRVSIEAVRSPASPVISDAEFKVTRSNTGSDNLRVFVNITQDQTYLDEPLSFFVTILANEEHKTVSLPSDYSGNVSGSLTATVEAGTGYLPAIAPKNAATVQMKVPASGAMVTISHQQGAYSVNEGAAFDLDVVLRTADGVAQPRGRVGFGLSHREGSAVATDYDSDLAAFVGTQYVEANEWVAAGTAFTKTKQFRVQTSQDTLAEGTQQFQVLLSPKTSQRALFNTNCPTGTYISEAANTHACAVTVTINDDDTLELQSVVVSSNPAADFYAVDEKISFAANFNGDITVTGTPQFTFDLGGNARVAAYTGTSAYDDVVEEETGRTNLVLNRSSLFGTHYAFFDYTVTAADVDDHDGIAWNDSALALNGGTIKLTHTDAAEQTAAVLTHVAQEALPVQRVDTTKPIFKEAAGGGNTVTMLYSEELSTTAPPVASFRVVVTGTQQTPREVSISGRRVVLTLPAGTILTTQTVTMSYAKRSGQVAIEDLSGKEADDLTSFSVIRDTTPPELVGSNPPVLAADGRTLTVTYNEPLSTTSVPINSVFTVEATPDGGSEVTLALATTGGVSVTGNTVMLTLDDPILPDHTLVKVSYTKPSSGAVIEDLAGNDAADFTDLDVTNNSTVPRVSIEAVYDDATPLLAPPVFRVTRSIASAAPLTVNVTITQDAQYIASNYFTDPNLTSSQLATRLLTIPANLTSVEKAIFVPTSSGSHGNGALTLTVAGGDDHLPTLGSEVSATVQMKMPVPDLPLLRQNDLVGVKIQQTDSSVSEPDVAFDLNLALIATTAKGVAKPRALDFTVAIYTEAVTAEINRDYDHISKNIQFGWAAWRPTGDGAYTQTVIVPDLKIHPDDEHEADETFEVILQNTPGVSQRIRLDRTPVEVTIVDDGVDVLDIAEVLVASAPATAGSDYYLDAEVISFTVVIDGKVAVDVTNGTPQFMFEIGGQPRLADYVSAVYTAENDALALLTLETDPAPGKAVVLLHGGQRGRRPRRHLLADERAEPERRHHQVRSHGPAPADRRPIWTSPRRIHCRATRWTPRRRPSSQPSAVETR